MCCVYVSELNLSTTTCYDKIKKVCLLVCISNAHVRHWNVINLCSLFDKLPSLSLLCLCNLNFCFEFLPIIQLFIHIKLFIINQIMEIPQTITI